MRQTSRQLSSSSWNVCDRVAARWSKLKKMSMLRSLRLPSQSLLSSLQPSLDKTPICSFCTRHRKRCSAHQSKVRMLWKPVAAGQWWHRSVQIRMTPWHLSGTICSARKLLELGLLPCMQISLPVGILPAYGVDWPQWWNGAAWMELESKRGGGNSFQLWQTKALLQTYFFRWFTATVQNGAKP